VTVDVNSLSAARQEVLQQFLQGKLSLRSAESSIQPIPRDAVAPLSLAQEQMWRQSLEVPIPLYNESITLYRNGPLKIEVLEQSIAEIIRRHEIWRTSYDVIDGSPSQIVQAFDSLPLFLVDLRSAPEEERHALALHVATEDARRPFDLRAGPLLRAQLIRMDEEVYRLAITAHLSIVDGVSVYQILPRELATLYNAFCAGRPSPLPELSIQYRDFAHWQRKWFLDHEMERQLEYWRTQLGGELRPLDWPRVSRPSVRTFRGATHSCNFPIEILLGIRNLCRNTVTTIFTVLEATLTMLLCLYTSQTDIIVGTFCPAGRKRSEVQPLLGHFLNPLPLRVGLSDDPTFLELIKRAQLVISAAISHDDVPLELLAHELLTSLNQSRHPFFTVGISLQPRTSPTESGWDVTSMDAPSGGAIWDLYMAFIERPDQLLGRIQFNSDLFDLQVIEQFVQDFSALLKAATAHPEQRVSQLTSGI
jgi:hypothetical protein